jgi:ketosteroid isomerase-like protein
MKILKFSLIFFIFLIISCDSTSPEIYAEAKIDEILTELVLSFNANDLDQIMQYYHQDYKQFQNGYYLSKSDIYDKWEYRLAEYLMLEIDDREIELIGDFRAVVHCKMSFLSLTGVLEFDEPSQENGDISYFYKTVSGEWKICGENFHEFGKTRLIED